jgi:hypothetical protein
VWLINSITLKINELNVQKLGRKWKKFKESNTIIENHSTVTDFARFLG